jgi:hypothetical protein
MDDLSESTPSRICAKNVENYERQVSALICSDDAKTRIPREGGYGDVRG